MLVINDWYYNAFHDALGIVTSKEHEPENIITLLFFKTSLRGFQQEQTKLLTGRHL